MASLTRTALNQLVVDNLSSGTSITAAEHRAVEYAIIDSCKPYNSGYFVLHDVGGTTGALTVYGCLSATASNPSGTSNTSKIVVVFNTATPMPSANYYVRMFIKSVTAGGNQDTYAPYFANTSTTGFDVWIREQTGATQDITIYFEAIPLD